MFYYEKTTKTLVSILLAVMLSLSALPLSVFAFDGSEMQSETETDRYDDGAVLLSAEDDPFISLAITDSEIVCRLPNQEPDLNSIVVSCADGSRSILYYTNPVKYIDESGKIKDKLLTIESVSEGGFRTEQSDIVTTFGKTVNEGVLIKKGDIAIKLTPLSSEKNQSLKSVENGSEALCNGVLSADRKTVTYQVDSKTDYIYSLTSMGFKEDITVSSYTGQSEFYFMLESGGLTPVCIDETYYLQNEHGTICASLGDVLVFTADEKNNTFGTMSLTTVKENSFYIVCLSVDSKWLSDPKTQYPIVIDPSISITVDNTTAGEIQDINISTATTYSATSGSLYVGKNSDSSVRRALMRFEGLDVSGYNITSARIWLRDLMCQSTPQTVECRKYTGTAWSNSSPATWNGCGSNMVGSLISSKTVKYGNGDTAITNNKHTYAFDITSLARQWANGSASPSQGIIFKADDTYENDSESLRYKTFASIDRSANNPSLVIEYTTSVHFAQDEYSVDCDTSVSVLPSVNPVNTAISYTIAPYNSDTLTNGASVNSSGTVSVTRLGKYILTATAPDGTSDSCVIYGTLESGVYRFQNGGSYNYATFNGNGVLSMTTLVQYSNMADNLKQMWKVKYVGDGYYTIRPMVNLSSMIKIRGNADSGENSLIYDDVIIKPSSYQDTSGISAEYLWSIRSINSGYCRIENVSNGKVWETVAGETGNYGNINTATESGATSTWQNWYASKVNSAPEGINLYYVYGATTLQVINNINLYDSEVREMRALQYSEDDISQNFRWTSSNSNIASVNISTGVITANNPGETTIRVQHSATGLSTSFTVNVRFSCTLTLCASSTLVVYDDVYDLVGHAFVEITNNTSQTVTVCGINIAPLDSLTVSRFPGFCFFDFFDASGTILNRIWYNYDAYAYHEKSLFHDNSAYSIGLKYESFSDFDTIVSQQSNSYVLLGVNCVNFTVDVWNYVFGEFYLDIDATDLQAPGLLKVQIDSWDGHIDYYVPNEQNCFLHYSIFGNRYVHEY